MEQQIHCLFVSLILITILSAGCTTFIRDETHSEAGLAMQVTVLSVTDGDTIRVRMPDETKEVVRLLGIDTPEKTPENNHPFEYGTIDDTSYLALWGEEAARFTRDSLTKETVLLASDKDAPSRDPYGRLLAYVIYKGEDFNALLVSRGLARVYVAETFSHKQEYLALEDAARKGGVGLWQYRKDEEMPEQPAGVYILDVIYDAAGDDETNLNGERICIANAGETPVEIKGWCVQESGGIRYSFSDGIIPGHGRVTLFIGSGTDTLTDRYWNLGTPVLGNRGDTVMLYDNSGVLVSSFGW
ncbi:MAG: thermonuclease family protein [Methanospirillaceae archaeon]|nr:thermonuclease family protein [Methanospirillaceae archaeon]